MKRLGFLHIPKCAGTALRKNIFQALDLTPTHINKVIIDDDSSNKYVIKRKSLTHNLASNTIFLSGHITFKELKELKRDFIFTYMRDPKERLFSLYTYALSRATNENALKNHPSLIRHLNQSFVDFLKETSSNKMANLLVSDCFDGQLYNEMEFKGSLSKLTLSELSTISNALNRLDKIFGGDCQYIIDYFDSKGLFKRFDLPKLNESIVNKVINIGCSKEEFLYLVNKYTWLDEVIFQEAIKLPQSENLKQLSEYDFIEKLQKRYSLKFSSSN